MNFPNKNTNTNPYKQQFSIANFDSNESKKKVKPIKKEERITNFISIVWFLFRSAVGLIHAIEWNMEMNNTLNRSLTNSQIYDGEFFEVVATEGDILVVR